MKCEILVRDCIAGLLVQLSNDDFKAMEGKENIRRLNADTIFVEKKN